MDADRLKGRRVGMVPFSQAVPDSLHSVPRDLRLRLWPVVVASFDVGTEGGRYEDVCDQQGERGHSHVHGI